jgi:branched-chain amino acid transport system ATP-binding protein
MSALLECQAVTKAFGGLVAVDEVQFAIPEGSIVSLIGPNGAGKTTFFNMLTGVYKPTAGRVLFAGEDMTGKPPHAFTQRGIGRTFQNIRLFQNMTALENVLVGMHVRLKGNLFEAILRTPRVKREERDARVCAPASCSSSAGSCARRPSSARTCRTATSAGSRSRGRSRPSRSSCCSTSRRPA